MDLSTVYVFPEETEEYIRHRKKALLLITLFAVVLIISSSLFFTFRNSVGNVNSILNEKNTLSLNFKNFSLITESGSSTVSEIYFNSERKAEVKIASSNVNADCVKRPFDKYFVNTLSVDEKIAVNQLKAAALAIINYTFCDVNSENYLARWLKLKNWDVSEAEQALLNNLEWRKQEKIDEILAEDFSYFKDIVPIFFDGVDYTGRMVTTLDSSSMDMRKLIVIGQGDNYLRYLTYCYETNSNAISEAQIRGQNITQSILIINLQGLNMRQHGCEKCTQLFYKLFGLVEDNYPDTFYKIFLINTPDDFEWIFQIFIALLPASATGSVEVFGSNKEEWHEVILQLVPVDQIRPIFGGTKLDTSDESY